MELGSELRLLAEPPKTRRPVWPGLAVLVTDTCDLLKTELWLLIGWLVLKTGLWLLIGWLVGTDPEAARCCGGLVFLE